MSDRNFYVYKHTSPSNKVYIGITINPNFTDRERKAEWQSWDYQPRRSVFRVHTLNGARVLNTKIYVDLFI